MRSATRVGMVFVGSQTGQVGPRSAPATFRPKVVRPDPQVRDQREVYRKNIQALAEQLKALLATAVDPDEIDFWAQRLGQLKGL